MEKNENELTEEEFKQLMAQMAKPKKIKLSLIPIVMFTAPLMIPLDMLKTALIKKRQMQQWNSFMTMMNELNRTQGKCNCQNCAGHCHE